MPGRTIAIGDIHGCANALTRLLEAIEPRTNDRVILLGDYVDRGPDSRKAMDILMDLRSRCWLIPLMGNHDKMLLGLLLGKEYMFSNWMALGGKATLQSFQVIGPQYIPERYISFLRSCVPAYETAGYLFLHANYLPNTCIEEQPQYVLRWESLKVRCPPPHYSGKTVILGHTAQKNGRILDLGYLKCIDTFCYGGGWLTALDVDSGECWQANQHDELRNVELRANAGRS